MAGNKNLNAAAKAKNDEFYTQYEDIQKEINCYDKEIFRDKTILLPCDDPEWSNFTKFFAANFEFFGLKKLISTSYAVNSKKIKFPVQPTLWEAASPNFNPTITDSRGKIFVLERGTNSGRIDIDNLQWDYLNGDGDFRSDEVKKLRDQADIIITNPPFSLFREFLAWILDGGKNFLIIGNQNAITYREIFPLIMEDKIWLGNGFRGKDPAFKVPPDYEPRETRFWIDENGQKWRSFGNMCWFTNIDIKKRHEPLKLMTLARNIRFSRHKEIKGVGYKKYDNYDALEVPFTDAIPSDYDGVMGVPITFLDKYCPEQFEIVGKIDTGTIDEYNIANPVINGKSIYKRIAIRRRRENENDTEN